MGVLIVNSGKANLFLLKRAFQKSSLYPVKHPIKEIHTYFQMMSNEAGYILSIT